MYEHYDKDGAAVSLHDCYAEKATFENGVLTFYFPDGFWIGADHEENSTGTTVRTDASEVRFQLEFGEEEDVTVYVFTEEKPYHKECELRIRVKDVTYCWNRLVVDRTW